MGDKISYQDGLHNRKWHCKSHQLFFTDCVPCWWVIRLKLMAEINRLRPLFRIRWKYTSGFIDGIFFGFSLGIIASYINFFVVMETHAPLP